jgi:hypothetical protein
MATMMKPMMTQDPDAAAEGAEQMGSAAGEGEVKEFVIRMVADGSLSVYREVNEDESAEQNAQPVRDIGQACQEALKWYQESSSQGASETADQQFDAGFKSRQVGGQIPA